MVVAFTPNVGLAKPDESELAKNWALSPFLAEDNNLIIVDKSDTNMTQYTPTLLGATSNPSVGAGSTQGEWQEFGGFVFGRFIVLFGNPGVSVGSGEYGISLPVPADAIYHNVGGALNSAPGTFSCIGEGYIRDASTSTNCGTVALDVVTISGTSYARLITETHAGKTSRMFRDNMPFAVTDADNFAGNFFYKKA